MKDDIEAIREAVSQHTGAKYESRNPEPGFPTTGRDILWFLASPISAKGLKTVAPLIWETTDGIVHVESMELGNTSDWVEESYGEKGVAKVRAMDLDFSKPATQHEFGKRFPKAQERISHYKDVLANVSKNRGASLSVSFDKYERIVTFYAIAEFRTLGLDAQAKVEKIKLTIDAIKEALVEITKYEERRSESAR